jgi:hypothetical protein
MEKFFFCRTYLEIIEILAVSTIARVRCRGDLPILVGFDPGNRENGANKGFLFFISGEREWESPPSILVNRNPNWFQRMGMGIGCVKRRYEHLKYVLPEVSCIV